METPTEVVQAHLAGRSARERLNGGLRGFRAARFREADGPTGACDPFAQAGDANPTARFPVLQGGVRAQGRLTQAPAKGLEIRCTRGAFRR